MNQRVKVFSSKTNPPQWITGTIVHRSNKKVCILSDSHWSECIQNRTYNTKAYEWFDKDDNNFKELNDDIIEYSKLATSDGASTINADSYEIISNEVIIENSINEIHQIEEGDDSDSYYFHQIFHDHTKQFQTASKITELTMYSNKQLIYIESLKQLFAFVGKTVFHCDIVSIKKPNSV